MFPQRRESREALYYIYLVRCADNSLYTGITTDLSRRLREHAGRGGKGAKYTASHPVRVLCAAWSAQTRSEALRLEYRIKCLDKARKERLAAHSAELVSVLGADYVSYLPVDVSEDGKVLGMLGDV